MASDFGIDQKVLKRLAFFLDNTVTVATFGKFSKDQSALFIHFVFVA